MPADARSSFKLSLICPDFSIGKLCKTFAFCGIIATPNAYFPIRFCLLRIDAKQPWSTFEQCVEKLVRC